MAHALTAHTCLSNLNTAFIADNALIANLLILTAVAFPVFARSENALAEQSVCLRLQRSVVNRLRLGDFTV